MFNKNKLADFVCDLKGCSKAEFFGRTRKRPVVEARMLFWYAADHLGMNIEQAADYIGKHRTTLIYYTEVNKWLADKDKYYKHVHNFVQNDLNVPKFSSKVTAILRKYVYSHEKIRRIAEEINEAYAADRLDQAPVHPR